MITSAAIYHVLHFFHITIDIRNVCVFLAPLFSSFTTIVAYHLTKELKVRGRSGAYLAGLPEEQGLFAFWKGSSQLYRSFGGDRRAGQNPELLGNGRSGLKFRFNTRFLFLRGISVHSMAW